MEFCVFCQKTFHGCEKGFKLQTLTGIYSLMVFGKCTDVFMEIFFLVGEEGLRGEG